MSDPRREWLSLYLNSLPPDMRTTPSDPKLKEAAKTAWANGWDAAQIAQAVSASDYSQALYPSLIAIQRLAEIGATRPPKQRQQWGRGEWNEGHCGRAGCSCTHDDGCHKGWVDSPPASEQPTAAPCRNCRPVLYGRISEIPPPGQRTPSDLAHIRNDRGHE